MAETSIKKGEKVSFMKELLNRRVPQIMGLYLGGSWGIIQFVEWLVNRYLFSPHLVELALVILGSLLPSVFVIAYFHGKPGADKWRKPERIIVPANVIIAGLVVFFVFGQQDLSSLSQKVTLEDETGQKIQRVVPKQNHLKKIALFYFDNTSGDKELDWLQYGFTSMLEYDLRQDLFFETYSPNEQAFPTMDYFIFNKIKAAGFGNGVGLPLLLKKKIAGDLRMDYFLGGKLRKEKDEYIIETSLYKTENASLAASHEIRGKDIFNLTDRLTVHLKKDLKLPMGHIEKVNDFPVAEIFTASETAARLFIQSKTKSIFQGDWKGAGVLMEKAMKEDPTFAVGCISLVLHYMLTNQTEKLEQAGQELMKLSYKLPETLQYHAKIIYYGIKGDAPKQFALLKLLGKLQPHDVKTQMLYAVILLNKNELDEAIVVLERVLEIDPQRYVVYRYLGEIYESKGDKQRSQEYFEKFTRHASEGVETLVAMGDMSERKGELEKAKSHYEQALLMKPEDVSTSMKLGLILEHTGDYDAALKRYRETLENCKTEREKAKVWTQLSDYYERRGQMDMALDAKRKMLEASKKIMAPMIYEISRISVSGILVKAGRFDEAKKILEDCKLKIPSPNNKIIALGYIKYFLRQGQLEEVEKQIPVLEEFIKIAASDILKTIISNTRAQVHEIKGDYAAAIKNCDEGLKVDLNYKSLKMIKARCLGRLKRYEEAETILREILIKDPYNPEWNYELAVIYLDMGRKDAASEHLRRSLETWKEADANYEPAQKAKTIMTKSSNG